jgi:hypothetical protein
LAKWASTSTALRIASPSSGIVADQLLPLTVAATPLTSTDDSESPWVTSKVPVIVCVFDAVYTLRWSTVRLLHAASNKAVATSAQRPHRLLNMFPPIAGRLRGEALQLPCCLAARRPGRDPQPGRGRTPRPALAATLRGVRYICNEF